MYLSYHVTINITMTNNPYESFYHGLVVSKLWLCEILESVLDTEGIVKPSVNVLGGWHNLMSFMLVIRDAKRYRELNSYDKDQESTDVANRICDTWRIEEPRIRNHTIDVSLMDFSNTRNTVFINCSVDQFENTDWYQTIPKGSIVCMQTTDIVDENPPWEINQRTKDLPTLIERYPMTTIMYQGVKNIKYPNMEYNRLMLVGYK